MSFIEGIKQKAKADKKTIVLPETSDIRTLQAAHKILEEGFADIILLGDEEQIKAVDSTLNLQKAQFINPNNTSLLEEFVELFVELRGHKGMDAQKAR